jgi:hypothetical protein
MSNSIQIRQVQAPSSARSANVFALVALVFPLFAGRAFADGEPKAPGGTAPAPFTPPIRTVAATSAPMPQPSSASAVSPSVSGAATPRRREVEFLVPPGGAAFDVLMHARDVVILSFPEPMAPEGKASSRDFEVKPWGEGSVAVRASENAQTSTLALATRSGAMKINLTLRVVPESEDALTMVRFKLVSAEEAFEARVATELRQRLAPLQARLAEAKRRQEELVLEKAEALIIERALKRNESLTLRAHERNEDAVIAHVRRASLLGDDGYLFFVLENRGDMPFRVASAKVSTAEGKTVPSAVRLVAAISKDPRLLGVVPPRATVRGVVVLRGADPLLAKPLMLEIAGPEGRGAIRLTKGITLK